MASPSFVRLEGIIGKSHPTLFSIIQENYTIYRTNVQLKITNGRDSSEGDFLMFGVLLPVGNLINGFI